MNHKSKIIASLIIALILFIIPVSCFAISEYFQDNYWEWHTRTTTTDQAYNGKHIQFLNNKIDFYGYGITSYKDYLYKEYENPGERIFRFQLDESRANYHTLDGAGFIFNAKEDNGKLTGDVLVINQNQIIIYRLDNININIFETTSNKILANYATRVLATTSKPNTAIHQFEIKTSPTKVTVNDNGTTVIDLSLDYATHAGEGFGLIVSYLEHNCNRLTQIEFSEFGLEVKDYIVPIYLTDRNKNGLQGGVFEILNQSHEVVKIGTTNAGGKVEINGLLPGIYSVRQKTAPIGYKFNTNEIDFLYTNEGKVLNLQSNEEINLSYINDRINAKIRKYTADTKMQISGAQVGLCDKDGNILKTSNGKEIIATTDENGEVDFGSLVLLPSGTYYYKDISTIDGYRVDKQIYSFTVNNNGSTTYADNNGIIYNDRVSVTIKKLDKSTEEGIAGVKIGLYDKNGNAIKINDGKDLVFTTDQNGEINIEKDVILQSGTYYYKDISKVNGYKSDETIYSFTISENGNVTYSQNNGIHYLEKEVKQEEKKEEQKRQDSPKILPNAGKKILGISIVALITSVGIGYFKYRKFRV